MVKHTVDTTKEVEEIWEKYEKEYDANFNKMANHAILEYLNKKLEGIRS